MCLPPIKFKGSVKNVRGRDSSHPFVFEFSNQYSIYDWGIMPDTLAGKGESLAFVTNLFFNLFGNKNEWSSWRSIDDPTFKLRNLKTLNYLINNGLDHHSKGLVNKQMARVSNYSRSNYLEVTPIDIIHPKSKSTNNKLTWDYVDYKSSPTNCLVPLEVIFRFNIPNGSSLLSRASDKSYCKGIGLSSPPRVGDSYTEPLIEFSTKLETKDSYITYDKAKEIAHLNSSEFEKLYDLTTLLALRLKDYFREVGVELLDGKFEFAFTKSENCNSRGFSLVDSITPDELRLQYKNIQLSKENLRNYYNSSDWAKNVKKSKKIASERGEKDWKSICTDELNSSPSKLEPKMKEIFEMVYKSLANTLSLKHYHTTLFCDAYSLDELIERM